MVRVTVDSLPSIQRGASLSRGTRSSSERASISSWNGDTQEARSSSKDVLDLDAAKYSMDAASVQRNYESLSRMMQVKQAELEQVRLPRKLCPTRMGSETHDCDC